MFNSLVLTTLFLPFVFGLALGLAGRFGGRWSLPLAFVLLSLAYMLLEGTPAFPPVASKQKLLYLFALAAFVAVIPRKRLPMPVLVGAFLLAAAGWLGINKFASGGVMANAFVLAPIVAASLGSLALPRAESQPLLWPSALLCLAIGAALLSALGTFVGFAQVAGACAALIGGYALVRYLLVVIGRGAGFYDRFLEGLGGVGGGRPVRVAVAFDEQVVDAVPVEGHDARVEWIVTPTELIRAGLAA